MPSLLSPVAAVIAAGALVALGCGRPESAADRQFADLREQVSKLEADHDKVDQRLGALELAAADEKTAPPEGSRAAAAAAPGGAATQPLRVVQLGGAGDGEGEDPNDKSERPDIRVTGAAGAAAPRPRAGKSGRARIEESEPSAIRPDASRSSALDPDAKAAYEAALAQVQGKQYDRGLEGLNAFLVRWPDHPYAENAMYWRGEAYFAQGEYLRAGEQFEAVLARFGSGKKSPDALLKLGMCQERLGATARAREYWDRLKTEYPKSEAAKRIPTSSGTSSLPKGPKENR
ncbi:MAG TPA: tol-pal system protein YbgF [Labilithrix sp.]|nr:tol-pal system protein YbgF [Labilithrix sp.]